LTGVATAVAGSALPGPIAAPEVAQGQLAPPAAQLALLRNEMDDAGALAQRTLPLTLRRGSVPDQHLLAHAHPHYGFVHWHG